MRKLAILLRSSWYGWANGFRYTSDEKQKKIVEIIGFFVLIAALYWLGRAVFRAAEIQLSDAYGTTILNLINIFMTLGVCVLMKDAMEGALTQLYEAPDTTLLLASPLPPSTVFGFKLIQVIASNSLSMVIWLFPPWFALGQFFHLPWHFYLALVPACFCLLVIIVSEISILTMLIVRFFSSRPMIKFLKILGPTVGVAAGFLISVSFLIPDQAGRFTLDWLKAPESDWLSHLWVAKLMMAWLPESNTNALRWSTQLVGVGAGVSVLSVLIASKIYYRSWEYARRVERKAGQKGKKQFGISVVGRGKIRSILAKDLLVFMRNRKQMTTIVILTLFVLVGMVLTISEIQNGGAGDRDDYISLYIGLGIQILGYGVIVTMGLTWGAFKAEAKTWWILKSGPVSPELLFRSKILIATLCSVAYTNICFCLWLMLFRISLVLWLPILTVATITTTTVIAFNTAMGALPWVAEIGESYRDSRKRPASRIATILLTIAANATLLSPALGWGIVVLGEEPIKMPQQLGIAATMVVMIGVWRLFYMSGKRSLRKLLS